MASAWHEEKAASEVFLPLVRLHGRLLKAGVEVCWVFVWQQFAYLHQKPQASVCVCRQGLALSKSLQEEGNFLKGGEWWKQRE